MAERMMKESGAQWLGSIPATWEIGKIGQLYTERNTKCSDTDFEPLSVTMKGVLPQLSTAAKTDAHDDRKLVKMGDFAINSRSDRRGSCGIAEQDGSVSLINIILKPRNNMHPGFYNWLFHSTMFSDEFYKWGHGIVDDLWTTRWQDMKSIIVPIPSIEEQELISNFLDKKVSKIDNAIEKTKQSIEEYKKLKQSIITEAVTKGLNPNVEMRDSKIDTIGCVPSGWKTTKIKYILVDGEDSIKVGPFGSSIRGKMLPEGEYKVYNQAHLIANDFSLNRHFVNGDTFKELSQYQVVPGDVLFSMMGTIGKCQYMPDGYPRGIMDSHLIKGRLDTSKMSKQYFRYVYDKDNSRVVIDQFLKTSKGTIMDGLNSTIIKNVYIPYPDLAEQEQISDYLDNVCPKYDGLISKKEQIITELEQYKKSLIYEYVTGKKEVA